MTTPQAAFPEDWSFDSRFDGGDTGCGEMILDLRNHFRSLAPGARVAILARDPGAHIEVPAWCRVTRNPLLEARHPFYLVQVKDPEPAPGARQAQETPEEENRP